MSDPASGRRRLLIVEGQEGAGKSTIIRALLPHTPGAARIDAEDLGQVHPFTFDAAFLDLLWNNVAAVVENFWLAGYGTVIAGSFLRTRDDLAPFRRRLRSEADLFVIQLRASKAVRDRRRIEREKPSTREWRDRLDAAYPEDRSIAASPDGYRYLGIDDGELSVEETVAAIKRGIPEVYGPQPDDRAPVRPLPAR